MTSEDWPSQSGHPSWEPAPPARPHDSRPRGGASRATQWVVWLALLHSIIAIVLPRRRGNGCVAPVDARPSQVVRSFVEPTSGTCGRGGASGPYFPAGTQGPPDSVCGTG